MGKDEDGCNPELVEGAEFDGLFEIKVYNEWSDNGTDYTEIKRTRKVL